MAKCEITIKTRTGKAVEFLDQVAPIIEAWPDSKRRRFDDHWNALAANGAEIADMLWDGKRMTLYCAISDDYRRALADFGLRL